MSTDKPLELKHNIQHDIHSVLGAVGYPTKFWTTVKKHSVSGTIPVVAFNTLAQFSFAYLAAIMITSNDLSFMQNIKFFYLYLPSSYTFIAITLAVIAAASLTIGYVCRQEIKDEKKINEEIRGGQSDEINEIPQNALTIEIIPDFNNKEAKNFSIIVPISGKQGTTLTNQREENRNQIIFLAVPYIISGLMIAGALAGFGFSNINGWVEISIISLAVVIAVVGTLVTLNNLKNNKVNQQLNIVTKPGNPNCIPLLNVFIPFFNSGVAYVMKNEVESNNEENDPTSKALRLFEKFLTDFKNDTCDLLDKNLNEAVTLLEKRVLIPANSEIKDTLTHLQGIRGDLKEDLNDLTKDALYISKSIKELTGKVSPADVENIKNKVDSILSIVKNKAEEFQPSAWIGHFKKNKDIDSTINNPNELLNMMKKLDEKNKDLKEQLKEATKNIQELKQRAQNQLDGSSSSSSKDKDDSAELEDNVAAQRKRVRKLYLQKENNKLTQEEDKLTKDLVEQEETNVKQKETDEWQRKINGSPQEFLHYLLDHTKLKVEGDEISLRNFDNKIIINWKDGSQTTCYINKQGDLQIEPDTNVSFLNSHIQEAYKHVFLASAPAA